ncbi:MAG: hypothetical protein RJA22_386 [Verrucomicrobiota bacterium]
MVAQPHNAVRRPAFPPARRPVPAFGPRRLSSAALLLGVLAAGVVPAWGASSMRMTGITVRDGKAVVRWEGSGGPYQLLCRTNLQQDWVKVGPVTSGTSATNPAVAGPYCFFMVTSDLTPPAVPSGVQAQTNNCSAISLRWNAAFDNFGGSGVRAYSVYRNGALLRRVNAISNSIVDAGITSPATYQYTVVATDTVGNQSAPSAPVVVTMPNCNNLPPVARAGGDRTVTEGVELVLDGTQSYDPDGSLAAYEWDLGDGTSATGAMVTHVFARPGSYLATLRVTDSAGASAADSVVVTVMPANRPPVAVAGPDLAAAVGAGVAFNGGQSSDPDGSLVQHAWSFGDGSSANGLLVTHAYAAPGTYVATLTVTDDGQATASDSVVVTVTNVVVPNLPPVANAGPDKSAQVGALVSFDASQSRDPDGLITSYGWEFGDGTTGTGPTASWAYAAPGTYEVTLRVTDEWGAVAVDKAVVTVTAVPVGNQPPVADAGQDRTGTNRVPVSFHAGGSRDPEGSALVYQWNFGDGSTGAGLLVSHVYASAGQYVVELTVTDAGGATARDTAVVSVVASANQPPVAVAGSDQTWPVSSDFGFSAFASRDPDGTIASYEWDFGDGTRGSGMTVLHRYASAGSYTVRLTVTDNGGAVSSASVLANVLAPGSGALAGGTVLRGTNMGGTGIEQGLSVAVDRQGNVVLAGVQAGRPYVVKQSPLGETLWTFVPKGGGGGTVEGVAIDSQGDILLTGNFLYTQDFGGGALVSAGGYDIFLVKLSAAGTHLWSKRFGGSLSSSTPTESGLGVAVDTNDNSVVMTGFFQTEVNFGGGVLWPAYLDMFVAKFSAEGQYLWARQAGGSTAGTTGRAVAVDRSGAIFVGGEFACPARFGTQWVTNYAGINSDLFVAKYSSAGDFRWVNHYGQLNTQCRAVALAADGRGDIVVTGVSMGPNSLGGQVLTNRGMEDIVLAKYAGDTGRHLWSKSFGGTYWDMARAIAIDSANQITLAGTFSPSIDLGLGALQPSGGASGGAFAAKFSPEGAPLWSKGLPYGAVPTCVSLRTDGRIYLGGRCSGSLSFGGFNLTSAGQSDFLLLELAP